MRKIFLDCGSNLGQGLRAFIEKLSIDESWEVHCFEANPIAYNFLKNEDFGPVKPTFHNLAVWTEDCVREMTLQFWAGPVGVNGKKVSEDQWCGGGSSILPATEWKPYEVPEIGGPQEHFGHPVPVTCIDFAKWIETKLGVADIFVCKMDIEGAEYPVLESLIVQGTLDRFSGLFVEWHNHLIKGKHSQLEGAIRAWCAAKSIPVEAWH